jgi:S-adenosylmethionine-dependent methyltransferase
VVWAALGSVLDQPGLDVLDIGGGTGGFAVRVAGLGHRVTVVDPSPDALAALARRAREDGVEVAGQQGDLGSLLELAGPAGADVVLCHGVLEVVEDPAAALATIREVLRPGGRLSLLVAQRHAAVIARAMAGHVAQALALLDDPPHPSAQRTGRTGRRFTADELTGLLADAGFEVGSVHGIRVFADLVPGALLDLEPGTTAALLELERAVSDRPEYLPLAAQLHVIATR